MTQLELALWLADNEYQIFPCSGKMPLLTNWPEMATSDMDMVECWWEKHPNANIGISCSNLLVIDIDCKKENGFDWYKTLTEEQVMSLSGAMQVTTPSGGMHLYFRCPENNAKNTVGTIFPGLDTRAQGGYVMAPGNKGYVMDEEPKALSELEEIPDWFIKVIHKAKKSKATNEDMGIISSGNRNAALTSMAGTMRRIGMSLNEIYASLAVVNDERCEKKLTDKEVLNIAKSVAKYEPDQISTLMTEGVDEMKLSLLKRDRKEPKVPNELFHAGGIIEDFIEYNEECAPYPNDVIAFCGAVSFLSLLLGRRVRDEADVRTNMYILGLAQSGAGKDHPRKTNIRIAHKLGINHEIADDFASGEGIQDTLFQHPKILFQNDEMDKIIRAMNSGTDGRYENIMGTLLTMYSSSNSMFTMRKKAIASKEAIDLTPRFINQPHVSIFGTAIPNHYYEALSSRMLTNGFFSRLLIFDCGLRGPGQDPIVRQIPEKILEHCQAIKDIEADADELHVVYYSDEAKEVLKEFRRDCEKRYDQAALQGDQVGCAVWARTVEQTRKLALIHAFSRDPQAEEIFVENIMWASSLMMAMTNRMLYMADMYSSDSEIQKVCSKISSIIAMMPDQTIDHSTLMNRSKLSKKQITEAIETMVERQDMLIFSDGDGRFKKKKYRLI